MSQDPKFGEPRRSATQDANQGIINPPTIKTTASSFSSSRSVQVDTGVAQFGAALGSALAGRLKNESVNIDEQRMVDATMRQGEENAINRADATSKRTGWTKAVFGQNIEYRAAQQRAAQNAVASNYLEQAFQVDEFAGESSKEYKQRLKGGLDQVLAPYGDDVETKQLVASAYAISAGKLADKQAEAHYAYSQTQQRKTYVDKVDTAFDTMTLDAMSITTPEQAQAVIAGSHALFNGDLIPEGMDSIAARSVINEGINKSLRGGNIGAYNAAKEFGWFDNQSPSEQVAHDTAVKSYDVDFGNKVSLAYSTASLAWAEAVSLDQVESIHGNLKQNLTTLALRSSGTSKAALALMGKRVNAAEYVNSEEAKKLTKDKALEVALKKADVARRKAMDKAVEVELEQMQSDDLKAALRSTDPEEAAGILNEYAPKKDKLQEAQDAVFVEDISRLLGEGETVTSVEATRAVLTDPTIARQVANSIKGKQVDSPFLKRTIETVINGFNGLVDSDTGQINEKGITAFQSIDQFAQNKGGFMSMIGKENYHRLSVIQRGLSLKQTVPMIQKRLDALDLNKENRAKYSNNLVLGKGQNKRDHVSSQVHNITGKYPTPQALGHYMEEFDNGLVINQGDSTGANDYLYQSVQNAALNYNGHALEGGKGLDNVTEYNFKQLMDGAQRSWGNSASMLTGALHQLGNNLADDKGVALTKLAQDPSLNMYVVDGMDGFYLDSTSAVSGPVFISHDRMRTWAKAISENNNADRLKREAKYRRGNYEETPDGFRPIQR
tara:strand:- start:2357 stop:4699 length:2343 start_codon:yes stop_codon:yes gene_type:complete